MKLLVGLGNPGKKYMLSRHNIGFMVLDSLAYKHNLKFKYLRYSSYIVKGVIAGEQVMLAKPLTYMNLSGQAVKGMTQDLKIPSQDLLVIYDDLDLEVGTLRLRARGGSGGHRGLSSIMEELETEEFNRLKFGIGRPQYQEVRDYVLDRFTAQEEPVVKESIKKAVTAVEVYILEGIEEAMNQFNQRD